MSKRRIRTLGVLVAPFAVAGMVLGTAAIWAETAKPSMEVIPATGLKYSQTVTVKGHHLPKGSGSVAATICGLEDAAGKKIAKPVASDCAGADELGDLVQLKQWQSNGEFETQYKLPASGRKFGKNHRFCDKAHHCAVVVADANPDAPAYHVEKVIQFVDQKPFGTSTSPTTKPKPKPSGNTTTTKPGDNNGSGSNSGNNGTNGNGGAQPAAQPGIDADGTGDADMNPNNPKIHVEGKIGIHPPSGGAPALPSLPGAPGGDGGAPQLPPELTNALDQACTQIAAAVKQAGGDTTALTTACSSIKNGNGPEQLKTVLQSPSLLCVLGASAWQNNQQVTDACNQAATALKPVLAPLVGALDPVLGSL